MNKTGWIVMLLSVGSVLALVSFCFYKVLNLPSVEAEEHIHGPFEIEADVKSDTNYSE